MKLTPDQAENTRRMWAALDAHAEREEARRLRIEAEENARLWASEEGKAQLAIFRAQDAARHQAD